jgi:hypothetical protein
MGIGLDCAFFPSKIRREMIYDNLHLYLSDSCVTLEPATTLPGLPRETLVLNRTDNSILLNAPPAATLGQEERISVFGVIGLISLKGGLQNLISRRYVDCGYR